MASTNYYMYIYGSYYASRIDLIPLIEEIKWSENDMDSPNSGRTLDALMHRGKVATKLRFDIKLIPLEASVINPILSIIRNEYFSCITNAIPGAEGVTLQMYNSTRSGGISIITTDGKVKHKDVSFNIIQR